MKEIQLTHGKVALVDDDDYERLTVKRRWYYGTHGYAVYTIKRAGKSRAVLMHREITGCPEDLMVDHIDRNPLNNQRANLRVTDAFGNARNCSPRGGFSSRYKGVFYCKHTRRWRACIRLDGKSQDLGRFAVEVEAAKAYDVVAAKRFGSFAYLNFPDFAVGGDVGAVSLQCGTCGGRLGVVEFRGPQEFQAFQVCVKCLRFAADNAGHGQAVVYDEGRQPLIVDMEQPKQGDTDGVLASCF